MNTNNVSYLQNRQRVTQRRKDANDKQWYKDQADLLDSHSFSDTMGWGGISEYKRKKVNYDLFNNIINQADFEYVCKPYGGETGDLPATMANRDIVSGKIKVLLGMEMKMPFSWRVVATNEEATTRKEEQEFSMIRDYVISEVMTPIRQQVEQQLMQQNKGKKLTPQEQEEIQQQIAKETQARTPEEVKRYMQRGHQDPAEMQAQHILQYLIRKEKINDKFNKGWKHSLISGQEIYWIGIINGEPCMRVVNPLFFDHDKSPDIDEIENGEWAICEYRMTPSEVISTFGSELTTAEIDKVYQYNQNTPSHMMDADFTFNTDKADEPYTVRVIHCTWKSLRKIGFLSYWVQGMEDPQMKIVDENYRLNEEEGDIDIEWEWIPEAHEVYKILHDIYVHARPVPGQYKDLENLYDCKLPYYGACTDSLNSPTTSAMDRMKSYQYFYDILVYRTELLLASDKGKVLAANINMIPKSAGISIDKWLYFLEANKIAWYNPTEEGNRPGNGVDAGSFAKQIDMSLAADIDKYIQLAEYIERKCGSSIGVTPQMEAQASNEPVSNNRQNLIQASHIIQPYFELHNQVKASVLTGLIEVAKVAYATGKPKKLSYVMDDMDQYMFTVDQGLLENSTLGLFVANSSKAHDAKQAVEQLAQAALQNQQANLSDIIKIIRSESVTEAEELLDTASQREAENQQRMEQAKLEQQAKIEAKVDQRERDKWAHEERLVVIKEEERRKTEIQKQTIFSMGFDPNKDEDNDGTPDVLEVAKFGVDADIKMRKQNLDEEKFDHQQKVDAEKLDLEKKKIAAQKNKPKGNS